MSKKQNHIQTANRKKKRGKRSKSPNAICLTPFKAFAGRNSGWGKLK